MGAAPDAELEQRKEFAAKLQKIWEEYNIQCRNLPNINKVVLDLYKLYMLVKEKGGFSECTKSKLWKDVSTALETGVTAAAALVVKKKYVSIGVFHLECRHDLNGVDPLPLVAEMEKLKEAKESKRSGNNKANTSLSESNSSMPGTPTHGVNGVPNSASSSAKKSKKSSKDKFGKEQTPTQQQASAPNAQGMFLNIFFICSIL